MKRIGSLSGLSPVVPASTRELIAEIKKDRAKLKTYKGEMYLEKHQGTYTTQARNKYYNRKMEFALRDAEYFAAAAWKLKGAAYPAEKLDTIWREVLLYQFHDILPGSSIKRVYDESVARYQELLVEARGIADASRGLFTVKTEAVSPIKPAQGSHASPDILESATLKAVFNGNGELISVYDKVNNREVLAAPSNVLNVYEDGGDAWDMEDGYPDKLRGKFTLTGVRTYFANGGTVREQTLAYQGSTLKQTISVSDSCPILDFENTADWRESGKFLKASFSPAVFTDTVHCSCAYGNIKRSLLKNNDLERAQIEICAHRYIDLSENDYGVALLNDCKYGYTAAGNHIQISLLRAPHYPGADADQGEHRFSYALYSHKGAFENSDVAETAYVYNAGAKLGGIEGFLDFKTAGGAIVECVKRSEDGAGLIVRVAEEKGVRSGFGLTVPFPYQSVSLVTLDEKPLKVVKNLDFELQPFEIVTIKIV
ncbi:hypothetical protein FACS1894211_07080 [Clostridia bacterium]|nr:hypothetical protein FACS1894211_07080 [Clostridia bacterium]